jgi:phospholipid/cholesterol/gamma-HCH transport system ATP-binding protein
MGGVRFGGPAPKLPHVSEPLEGPVWKYWVALRIHPNTTRGRSEHGQNTPSLLPDHIKVLRGNTPILAKHDMPTSLLDSDPMLGRRIGTEKPIVSLRNVHKQFGSQVVLDRYSLDVEPAKTVVIMGPSGCGKSVTLKHIIGLLRPDSGEVSFDGQRIDTLTEQELIPVRLQIGLLFQMAALFDSMSVHENLEFPLIEHTKFNRAERAEKIRKALITVDLDGAQAKLPSQLSGGQKKRVALARAIVLSPRVVLYDEPTTGLDPVRADGINELIIKLKHEMGVTNVVVTHDLTSARKVADRVVMMLNGRIVADGTFEEVGASPDERVQHFLAGKYVKADDADEARLLAESERKMAATLRERVASMGAEHRK